VPSGIQAYVPQPNGEKTVAPLNEMIQRLKQRQNFGEDEVTIIVTGLPQTTETVKKATRKLVQAYIQRYNLQQQRQQGKQGSQDYQDQSGSGADPRWSSRWSGRAGGCSAAGRRSPASWWPSAPGRWSRAGPG